jgi:transcriptional antiterminator NusG
MRRPSTSSTESAEGPFKPGQKVRIIDGPFNEWFGTVGDIDMEKTKVRVLVSFYGRETPVELDFWQIEKA